MQRIEIQTYGQEWTEEIIINDEMPVELQIQLALEECGFAEDEYRLVRVGVKDELP